jgi:hypothetical protein
MKARLDALEANASPILSVATMGFTVEGFIGTQVLPYLPVPGRTAKVITFGKNGMQLTETRRPLRSEPNQIEISYSESEQTLESFAIQAPLDVEEIEASQTIGVDAVGDAIDACQLTVAIDREKQIADLVTTAASYSVGHKVTLTKGWNEKTDGVSDADPIEAIRAAWAPIRQAGGVEPNTVFMGWSTWNALLTNTFITSRLAGGTGSGIIQRQPTVADFAAMLEIDPANVLIGKATYDNDGTFTDLWGDYCGICYRNILRGARRRPTFGWTYGQQFGEVNGVPLLGVAGRWAPSPWAEAAWYGERRKPWLANVDMGYLISDTVQT